MCPSTLERLMRHFQWLSKSECVSGRIMTGQWYRPSRGISFLSTDEKSPIWNDQKSFTLKSLNFRGPELFYMSFQNEWLTFIVTSRSPFNIGLAYVGVSHKLIFLQFISDGVRAKISKSAQVVWERKLGVYSVIWKVLTAKKKKKRGKGLKPKKNVKK